MKFPTEPIKIHFFYVVVILLLILIWLSTWQLVGNAAILSHISLAGTVASLILADLAIIYAYLSNLSLMVNLGQLSQVSRDFVDNTDRLTEVRSDLKEYLETIQDIQSKVSSQGERLELIYERLPQEFAKDPQSVDISETLLMQFIQRLTTPALYILYILSLGYRHGSFFTLEDIVSRLNFFHQDDSAISAYIDAFSALGLVEVGISARGGSNNDGDFLPTLYRVTYVHPIVQSSIKEVLSSMDAANTSNPTSAARFASDVAMIEDYFATPQPAG